MLPKRLSEQRIETVPERGRYMHRIIDWNELWKAIHASTPGRLEKERDPAAIWDRRAAAYQRVTRDETKATEQELAFLDLRAGDTVLDVGAGTGRLAVPIAHTAAHVTALDPSAGMLSHLRERMVSEGLTNYSCVRMRWEDVAIGRDIKPHDMVIAAFSLGFYDLAAALRKLDAAARRSVYLFWHAGEWRSPDEMALYRAIFGEEGAMKKGYPDYIYPVNILHDAGIYPDVRIYRAVWETVYDSVEEAVKNWVTMHNPGQEDLSPVREYFSRVLSRNESGKYLDMTVRPTAAVWWIKEEGNGSQRN
jgi:SAM-dependent methyltransferase